MPHGTYLLGFKAAAGLLHRTVGLNQVVIATRLEEV